MTVFEKNVAALETYYPELLPFLTADVRTDHIEVIRAKSGAARLMVRTDRGETVAVHNSDDPEAVAEDSAEKIDVDKGGVLVLFGMGLGYLAKALGSRLQEGGALIVYEADPGIFKTALKEVDLTELLSSHRVKVVVGEDAKLDQWCHRFMLLTGGATRAVRAIRYEPSFKLAPLIYEEKLDKELVDFTKATNMNFTTVRGFGPLFTNNLFEAVPHIMFTEGVKTLQGLFPGLPAILVAAGPSLEKNVRQLQQAKGRAVIIAADTVLGYLLQREITPDFLMSVDPQERTYDKYKGVDIASEISLVFTPGCSDRIFKRFPGRKFVVEQSMLPYQWLKEYWTDKGSIAARVQCQIQLGFNLAEWMGCDPIVFVGQDLCFTDELMFVKSGSYMTPDEEARNVKRGIKTKNMFGETLGTNQQFLTYKATYELMIKDFPGICINATEGGVKLEGALTRRLADVVAELCDDTNVCVIDVLQTLEQTQDVPDWDGMIKEVRDRERDFVRLERVSARLCKLLDLIVEHRATHASKTDARLIDLTHRAEKLTSLVPSYGKALDLLQMMDFKLELYMVKETTHTLDLLEDADEKLTKQIERGQRYYGDLLRMIPAIQPGITRLRTRLEKMRDLDAAEKQESEDCLNVAKEYVAIDLFDRAQQALNTYDDFGGSDKRLDARHAEISIRVALQLNRLRDAFDRAEEARQAFPDNSAIKVLSQEASAALAAWEERVDVARASLPESKGVSEIAMEAGDFYCRVGEFALAAKHYRAAATGSSSGEAYYRLAKVSRELGQDDDAVSALEHALAHVPADPRIYYDLGVLAIDQARLDVAEQFFWKGVEVSLDDPEFCEASAAILCAVDANQQAIPFYERALERMPGDPELLRKIAQAYESVFEPTLSV